MSSISFGLFFAIPVAAQVRASASLIPHAETKRLFGQRFSRDHARWSVVIINEGKLPIKLWESATCAAFINAGVPMTFSDAIRSDLAELEHRSPWEVGARMAENAAISGLLLGITQQVAMRPELQAGLAAFVAFGKPLAGLIRAEKPDMRGNFERQAWRQDGRTLGPGEAHQAVMFSNRPPRSALPQAIIVQLN